MPEPSQIFFAEIPKILASGPKTHREIADDLQQEYPECCDDSIRCPHYKYNAEIPEWDHIVRNAEQRLKKEKIIKHNPDIRKWELI